LKFKMPVAGTGKKGEKSVASRRKSGK